MSSKNINTKGREFQELSAEERGTIYGMLIKKATQEEIAKELGRSQSTVSREIKRGSVIQLDTHRREYKKYYADSGQRVCEENKGRRKFKPHAKYSKFIKEFEEEILGKEYRVYSVDSFVHEYKKSNPEEKVPCTKTVYNWIDKGYLKVKNIDLPMKVKRRRTNRNSKPKGENKRENGTSIEKRDEIVFKKVEKGHFEADLVLGKKGRNEQAVLTLVDITTRMAYTTIVSQSSQSVNSGIKELLAKIGEENVKTITTDNGSEFSSLSELEKEYSIKVYYTHAYCVWEKGTNERFNGMLREFLPKGRSINNVKEGSLQKMTEAINNRPRKVLNYLTPVELQSIL